MSKKSKVIVTPTEAQVLSELHLVAKSGDEINPNYIYPRREVRHSVRRRAVKQLAEKGVLLHHPAVDDHFDIFALGGNENIKISGEYDPEKIRRSVRLENSDTFAKTGQAHFKTKSWTDPDGEDEWHPTIDIENGAVRCDCPDFRYHRAKRNPSVWSRDEDICKHLRRGRANLERRGVLPKRVGDAKVACVKCQKSDAERYFETCDQDGVVIPGEFICPGCIQAPPVELVSNESAFLDEETEEQAEERLAAVFEVEHSPCPYCRQPTDEVEAETGAGLRSVRICLDCGEIKDDYQPPTTASIAWTLPRFPSPGKVTVSGARDTFAGGKKRDLIWVIDAGFEQRQVTQQLGFYWDQTGKRWWTDNATVAIRVAEYCDRTALQMLDERSPRWRDFRPDIASNGGEAVQAPIQQAA